jgi:hypothetical protein
VVPMMSDKEYEDLLAELRVAGLVIDPVPERVMFAAKASLSWRTIDAELAELTYDSALDDDRLSLVRGATAARMLTFSAGELTVDVEVEGTDGEIRLIGELAPAQQATVVVRHADGTTEVETDEDGRFRTGVLPAGPISLNLRLAAGGATVQTEWITL